MIASAPIGYLLSGLPGSGKSTYARDLERQGVVRLSVDETMISEYGRLGIDYPADQHLQLLPTVLRLVELRLVELVESGQSVVLDHGLGQRAERDHYKRLVVDHGGQWRLIHFRVAYQELLRRNLDRNEREGSVGGVLSPEALEWMAGNEQPPHGEGEVTIDQ